MVVEKTVTEAITYRRSVRIYKQEEEIDTKVVRKCLENAVLAPTSSNLQLWEFYHITSKDVQKKISAACFDQPAAKTAKQLVVIVARKNLWNKRAKANLNFLKKRSTGIVKIPIEIRNKNSNNSYRLYNLFFLASHKRIVTFTASNIAAR